MSGFEGYERADGTVGVRNHVAVMPSVACANGVVADIARRVPEAVLGLECGGSDAFPGNTANHAVGAVSDWLVSQGGTVILTENTEMIGTSHILERRAATPEVAQRIHEMTQVLKRGRATSWGLLL